MKLEMKPKERLICSLNLKEPDRVPIFEFIYSRPLYKEVLGRVPENYNAEDAMLCSVKMGYDMCFIPFGGQSGFQASNVSSGLYKDEWQTTYKKDKRSWPTDGPVDYPIKDRNDWINYIMPDHSLPSRTDGIRTALKIAKEAGTAVAGGIRGPFSSTMLLLGIENMSMSLYDDPGLISEIMGQCTDFYIEGGKRMISEGADVIMFADDYGSNQAPFISPALFRRFVLPNVKRMLDILKSFGVPVIMHSDGHIKPLLDSLVDAGISAYHPIERSAKMDLQESKQIYGKRICLIGNVNNKTTLVTGTVHDVVEETKECIRIAAPGGGYILCSDHSVHDDIPNENVFAIYDTGRKYGQYPIRL
jgi:uroporphyrinogen decarboxylase